MHEVARAARDDLKLEQLHLELRAGLGLEAFYGRFGWEVVGRWPGALRLSEHDNRDEVLMFLALPQQAPS
jgi:predicted N-acetyltransferase YhbS